MVRLVINDDGACYAESSKKWLQRSPNFVDCGRAAGTEVFRSDRRRGGGTWNWVGSWSCIATLSSSRCFIGSTVWIRS